MSRRRKLGSRRTEAHLVEDADVRAIPRLAGPYRSLGPEERQIGGAAPKSLVVFPAGTAGPYDHAYVAKSPSKCGARECVTEYMITCIGRMLPLRVAQGRLVRMPPPPTVVSDVRFLSRYFLPRKNEALMHGLEVIARCFEMDPAELRRQIPVRRDKERDFFTVDLIVEVLEQTQSGVVDGTSLREDFARMMAFDALVGANDRHPENWGLVYNALEPGPFRFAPIYDTARGLFWNYSDQQLTAEDARCRRKEFIEHYATHSKPLISAPAEALDLGQSPNHFAVIEHMVGSDTLGCARPIRQVISGFLPARCSRMLSSRFGRLFSRRRLEYIDALLRHRHARLKSICGLP